MLHNTMPSARNGETSLLNCPGPPLVVSSSLKQYTEGSGTAFSE